jgi:hypothetical protein
MEQIGTLRNTLTTMLTEYHRHSKISYEDANRFLTSLGAQPLRRLARYTVEVPIRAVAQVRVQACNRAEALNNARERLADELGPNITTHSHTLAEDDYTVTDGPADPPAVGDVPTTLTALRARTRESLGELVIAGKFDAVEANTIITAFELGKPFRFRTMQVDLPLYAVASAEVLAYDRASAIRAAMHHLHARGDLGAIQARPEQAVIHDDQ